MLMDTSHHDSTVTAIPDGSTTLLCPKLLDDLISLRRADGVYFQYGNALSTVSFYYIAALLFELY